MRCFHPCHTHQDEKACRAITISGPPSDQGRAVRDSYEHVGRSATPCDCPGLVQGVYTP